MVVFDREHRFVSCMVQVWANVPDPDDDNAPTEPRVHINAGATMSVVQTLELVGSLIEAVHNVNEWRSSVGLRAGADELRLHLDRREEVPPC